MSGVVFFCQESHFTAGQDSSISTTSQMHTHLGSRMPGRIVTRSKARGSDGVSTEADLLSAVLQQQASDPTAASKGDLTRKPAPLLPGQASIPAGVVASSRLSLPNAAAATAIPTPAAVAAASAKPHHQRSHSAGHAPKGTLQLQPEAANDLASLADTLVKASAGRAQEQQLMSSTAAGLQRRSARLAATVPVSKDGGTIITFSSSNKASLGRASAPARHHKRATDTSLAAQEGMPIRKGSLPPPAAAAVAAAADADAQPAAGAVDSPGTATHAVSNAAHSGAPTPGQARRVRFAAGPLNPEQHPNSTNDGHPASECALAVPVRRVPASYGMDLSKGNVLMLEQLLGAECSMSVSRLKRRVGLLPPIRPPRPHATGGTRPQ